jgi:hypothetical protein
MCVGIVRLRAWAESVSNATHLKPSLRELLSQYISGTDHH